MKFPLPTSTSVWSFMVGSIMIRARKGVGVPCGISTTNGTVEVGKSGGVASDEEHPDITNKKLSAASKATLSLRLQVFIFFIGNEPGGVHSQYLAKGTASTNPVAQSQSCQSRQISEIYLL